MAVYERLKTLVFFIFILKNLKPLYYLIKIYGLLGGSLKAYKYLLQKTIRLFRKTIPGTEALVQKQVKKSVDSIQKDMLPPANCTLRNYYSLPVKGLKAPQVLKEMEDYKKLADVDWAEGKVSGAVYHGGDELSKLLADAFSMFTVSNPLHPELFPGVRKMEAEIVSMVIDMYNGGTRPDVCGSMTSGGSESILMSIKSHRDRARDRNGITEPEMIVPISAHAAFDKGAAYFGVKLHHAPVNPKTGEVLVAKVEALINSNTIMLVGSTPGYPHGAIDDIPALGALAVKYGIGLHVDSCLGGFLIPFAESAGFPLPFHTDFRVDGVSSISCDTHKYGFAPKGSSVIMYNSTKLRKYQYFLQPNWPGGVYGSPTMAGSRPGALSAGCWAAMLHFGHSGYVETTRSILSAAMDIKAGIKKIDGLELIGDPLLCVVAFTSSSSSLNIYAVAGELSKKAYHLSVLQFPPSIHIACTMLTSKIVTQLLSDLDEIVTMLKNNPEKALGGKAAIYGTAASVPDRSIIGDVVCGFLDGLTLMPDQKVGFSVNPG